MINADPLQQVYEDLAWGKTKSHFDKVLELTGSVRKQFTQAVHSFEGEPTKSKRSYKTKQGYYVEL